MAETDTKEDLLRKLGSRSKDELVAQLGSKLNKDELLSLLGSRLKKDELAEVLDEPPRSQGRGDGEDDERASGRRSRSSAARGEDPGRDPGLIQPLPGQRVRVDLSGMPMLGVFAGRGTSAAGTITEVYVGGQILTVYLDAGFDGRKEVVVPSQRVRVES